MVYALRDMLAAGEEINMYVPTASDVEWAKGFLAVIKDDGIWEVPRLGIYRVSHTHKELQLIEQWGDDDYFDMDVAVFGMLGYRVIKRPAKRISVEQLN